MGREKCTLYHAYKCHKGNFKKNIRKKLQLVNKTVPEIEVSKQVLCMQLEHGKKIHGIFRKGPKQFMFPLLSFVI